jgi:hypothetical protein
MTDAYAKRTIVSVDFAPPPFMFAAVEEEQNKPQKLYHHEKNLKEWMAIVRAKVRERLYALRSRYDTYHATKPKQSAD